MENKVWALRYTTKRKELVERVRQKLEITKRELPRLHGVITDAAILELGLQELEKALDKELGQG